MAAVTRRAAPANTARMSSARETPAHHDGKASEDSDYPEDDHLYAVWSAGTLGGRVLRRSTAHTQVGLSETSPSEAAGVCQSR
jgi:hypothetical protein